MSRVMFRFATLALLLASTGLQAQQMQPFGDFEVHYNVLNTDQIPATVAQGYGIRRSPNRALLNITVLEGGENGPEAIHAKVTANAVNLTGQRREIDLREITDPDGAIYYIGELPIHNLETYNFTVNVSVDGEPEPFEVKFRQQFYTE